MKLEYTSTHTNVFVAQVTYTQTHSAILTARTIIKTKILNSRGLLTKYRQGLRRSGSSFINSLVAGQE